ncbi:hypothetical protein SAMN05660284_00161 [Formivibrio citricus]|uniref:VanZ like family protein n=1 Tax=Formivibrio citricus TaxID=83765 RepID=A0A1I4V7R2_9NEIS|nr:hypothetical protein [Formivibrio citricus]SFM97242.1 hypothetical protein SAMN05660284_00161 [Formivibrio citricus]
MKHIIAHTLRRSAWAPLLVLAFYAIAIKGFDAYVRWPDLDIPTHFAGGMAITYVYATLLRESQARLGTIPALIRSLCALGMTAITAILWEFMEFGTDYFFGMVTVLGVTDTLSDLFFGLAGGSATLAMLHLRALAPVPASVET